MMEIRSKKILLAVLPLIIALFSIFVVSKYASSTEFHAKTIETLDEKKLTVMELTAASTAASAAITLIPGDTATPIASKLADLSTYFLVVICAIYLEKYLLTITGYAAFTILIPIACILYSINVFLQNRTWKYLANKMILLAIAIVLVIPASVKTSNLIEDTYQSSIAETLDAARNTTEELENGTEQAEKENADAGLSGIISKVTKSVTDATTGVITKLENVLNHFIEALAVMLVTSCVIPIFVLLFFIWLAKAVLGIEIKNPNLPQA